MAYLTLFFVNKYWLLFEVHVDVLFLKNVLRNIKVPIKEKIEALAWLHAQNHLPLLIPRCFFSGRSLDSDPSSIAHSSNANSIISSSAEKHRVVSVAGVGSAVFFRHLHPFSFNDWLAIKRYVSFILHS